MRRRARTKPAASGSVGLDEATSVVHLDDASFEPGTEGGWTVVDFWAPWCGPCRAFLPAFEEVAQERATEQLRFALCNVDESPRTAGMVGVTTVPTVVLFDPVGNEVDRIVGVPPRRTLDALLARTEVAPET